VILVFHPYRWGKSAPINQEEMLTDPTDIYGTITPLQLLCLFHF
jgi:hypothetical protein